MFTNDPSRNASARYTDRLFGLHAGLGVEAPIARSMMFIEARYQQVNGLRLVPISMGLRLR